MLMSAESMTSRKRKQSSSLAGGVSDRVMAERMQIYEKLASSLGPGGRLESIFDSFSIPLKEKRKKAALTESLCESLNGARSYGFASA